MQVHSLTETIDVIALPDQKWGEVPCAFIDLKEIATATGNGLIAFTKEHMAGFKRPGKIVFKDLPTTSTGKIRKYGLRRQARANSSKTNQQDPAA
ncbi:hypothetical protein [uncultured Roseibium sp.]|uniref:AMP-binding enzyme n=1 Tax=uncultured Roseibium sp. TaxID=1936171 RepID=UPI002622B1C8|nr:hypothetical protein [uncultured Roseibium sp.]